MSAFKLLGIGLARDRLFCGCNTACGVWTERQTIIAECCGCEATVEMRAASVRPRKARRP